MKLNTDIALVGAGPIGIEVAVALQNAGLDYLHFESGQIGSTIAWWAPNTTFFSSNERIEIANVPLRTPEQQKATKEQYLNYLRNVVELYNLPIRTNARVVNAKKTSEGFCLDIAKSYSGVGGPGELAATEKTYQVSAKKLILAIGDMHRPKLINVDGEELAHVSHYFGDPHKYFRKKVVIVGGRNSAVEAAIRLSRMQTEVSVVYRQAEFDKKSVKFWLYPEISSMIKRGEITYYPNTIVDYISDSYVSVRSTEDDRQTKLDADYVLLLTGYVQDSTMFEQLGLELEGEEKKPKLSRRTMESRNIPGVFVAGTAIAGTQSSGVKEFIETSHVHARRIVAALTNCAPPEEDEQLDISELEQ